MCLSDLGDSHVEGVATGIQQVGTSGSQVDICAIVNEGIALCHITLEAVESAVLGDLHSHQAEVSL